MTILQRIPKKEKLELKVNLNASTQKGNSWLKVLELINKTK